MAMSSCPVVVGNEFCFDHEVQLQMKEEWFYNFGGFTVKDIYGKDIFEVRNHIFSHELFDMYGRKVAELVRKKFAWRITYHIYSGFEMIQRRATLHLRHFEFRKKGHVYIYQPPYATRDDPTNIDNMEPDIIIKSENVNFFQLISEVKMFSGGTGEEYAEISKDRANEVLGETSMQTYLLTVKPGVDVGLMVMCALFFNIAVKQEGRR